LGVVGMNAAGPAAFLVNFLVVGGRLLGDGQSRQRQDAALGEHDVAMAVRIGDGALVGEHGRERLCLIGVGELLRKPPGIFTAGAIVVVAIADPIHLGGVDGVAEHVLERAVGRAIPGDFGVAMVLAAQVLIRLAAGLDAMLAHAF